MRIDGPRPILSSKLTATTSQAEHSDSMAETPFRTEAQRARTVAKKGAIARARGIAVGEFF